MQSDFQDVWKIFPQNALRGRTWHWWWWLFFFENKEKPKYPIQLMILWGNRNCRKVRINDFMWEPKLPIIVGNNSCSFESVVASWFFDGEMMHDPFILEKGSTMTEWTGERGSIKMKSDRGEYSYEGRQANFALKVKNPDVLIDLRMQCWMDEMTKLVSTGKNFIGNMGYSMLKYRSLKASGKIHFGDTDMTVNGRAYFQKVRISSVTPCWYWGIVQWDNGAYMQYFLPHIGIPMFRQSYPHESSMDWGSRMVSSTLNYYDPVENKEYLLKDVSITKRYENDLPVMKVTARPAEGDEGYGEGIEVKAEMAAYGRCCWDIAQPFIRPIWLGIHYNEYPARLVDFSFKSKTRQINMGDSGKSYCNIEHSWGTI